MRSFGWYTEKIVHKATAPLPFGLREAFRNLFMELGFFFSHFRGLAKARTYRREKGLCLHMGCGNVYKPGWVNIDLGRMADIKLDLRRPLPFPNNSSSMICGEYFFEHIDYPEPALDVLQEYMRVLEPGGILSLVVPDIELVLNEYVFGGTEEYYEAQEKWHPQWCETKVDYINHNFRQYGEHRYSYDYETLSNIMAKSGFTNIRRREFNPKLDREDRIVGSLYVDCNKPG